MNNPFPLLGITGYSGSGETAPLEKLLPQLIKKAYVFQWLNTAITTLMWIKKEKDSWRMKEAGSAQVIMACDTRWDWWQKPLKSRFH